MALRPMASGTISFGLVAIPIKLFTTSETAKTVRFNNVHKTCGSRVKYQYYCPTDDQLVERDELTKGYEFSKGQYVLFTDEELKAMNPEPTNAIEITEFVPHRPGRPGLLRARPTTSVPTRAAPSPTGCWPRR